MPPPLPPPLRLAHLHLSSPISYAHSLRLQESILAQHFAHRDALRSQNQRPSPSSSDLQPEIHPPPPPPPPTLLTFSTQPTYTVGRRHLQSNPISAAQQAFLTAGGKAAFYASPRGGLLTYHAPGQLTAYAIVDLRRHGIRPRYFVRTLEKSVIRTCAHFGVKNVGTTADPGVWMMAGNEEFRAEGGLSGSAEGNNQRNSDRKICAVGVQISRGITSHGIGLNVWDCPFDDAHPLPHPDKSGITATTAAGSKNSPRAETEIEKRSTVPYNRSPESSQNPDPNPEETDDEGQGYLSWGFNRIVACGLEGKSVTWLARERPSSCSTAAVSGNNSTDITVEDVASVFAAEFARALSEDSTTTVITSTTLNSDKHLPRELNNVEKVLLEVEKITEGDVLQ